MLLKSHYENTSKPGMFTNKWNMLPQFTNNEENAHSIWNRLVRYRGKKTSPEEDERMQRKWDARRGMNANLLFLFVRDG